MTARDQVLASASRLFYAEGIRAVGVDRIAADANVSKMTLYRHFPTKDDLVVAVLRLRDKPARHMLAAATSSAETPVDSLLAGFAMLEPWFTSRTFRGCPFMNASLELADPGHPARAVAEEHKRAVRDHFADLARAAEAADPDALADQLAVLFDGAIAQAQIRDPVVVARAALRAAATLVNAAMAPPLRQ
jgi:AcrR family transcriptional regulator